MTLIESAPWAPGDRRVEPYLVVDLPHGLVPDGVRISVSESSAARAVVERRGELVCIRMPAAVEQRSVTVIVPASDAVAIWHPGSTQERGRMGPSWADLTESGPFSGAWLGALLGRNERVLVGFGARAGDGSLRARAGMIEETTDLLLQVDVDDPLVDLELVVDLTAGSLSTVAPRLGAAVGLQRTPVGPRHEDPVFCSWYAFHQAMNQDDLIREAEYAGRLGFGTVIVDDGWQNTDTDRGYGSCGDWTADAGKFPDARELVERISAAGLRTMFWVGLPWIGHRSAAYRDGDVALWYDQPSMDAAVLDPRSPRSRRHVVRRLRALLRETGAAGLKLDFLERFAVDDDRAPKDADLHDPSRAALALLDDLLEGEHDTDLMIEYREPYLSAETIGRGTMMRVADCPLSPQQNRLGVVDMRLVTSGIAVHSDPIMWSPTDSAERVAQHLLSGLFGVLQVSVLLSALARHHVRTLEHWLGFWQRHRDLLLHAPLHVEGADRGYRLVQVDGDGVIVTVLYAEGPLSVPPPGWRIWNLVNADEGPVIIRNGTGRFDVVIYDATGLVVERVGGVQLALATIPIPAGGRARITPTTS